MKPLTLTRIISLMMLPSFIAHSLMLAGAASSETEPNGEARRQETPALTAKTPLTEADLQIAFLKCTPASNAYISDDGKTVELIEGELFVIAKRPFTLSCRNIEIELHRDSIILITGTGHITKVYSLSMKPINAKALGYSATLNLGQELASADTMDELENVTQSDMIERRRAAVVHFAGAEDKLLQCEFSPLSMMKNDMMMRQIFRSKEPEKKIIAGKLLKVTVSLAIATAGHGQYLPVGPDVPKSSQSASESVPAQVQKPNSNI